MQKNIWIVKSHWQNILSYCHSGVTSQHNNMLSGEKSYKASSDKLRQRRGGEKARDLDSTVQPCSLYKYDSVLYLALLLDLTSAVQSVERVGARELAPASRCMRMHSRKHVPRIISLFTQDLVRNHHYVRLKIKRGPRRIKQLKLCFETAAIWSFQAGHSWTLHRGFNTNGFMGRYCEDGKDLSAWPSGN